MIRGIQYENQSPDLVQLQKRLERVHGIQGTLYTTTSQQNKKKIRSFIYDHAEKAKRKLQRAERKSAKAR